MLDSADLEHSCYHEMLCWTVVLMKMIGIQPSDEREGCRIRDYLMCSSSGDQWKTVDGEAGESQKLCSAGWSLSVSSMGNRNNALF